MRKIILLIIPLLLILACGTGGYMVFEDSSFVDAFYFTVITITTVGYGDVVPVHPAGRLFTVVLVFSGAGYVMYLFGQITEAMVEGGVQKIVGRRKMHKKIAKLNNHYIVCGFGRIGREICSILRENNRSFVVLERDEEVVRDIDKLGYIVLMGEASDDDVLIDAGIKRARGLIAVVSSDADNLYITLTARGLNQDLFILSRSSGTPGVGRKLKRAGASRVISPYAIGARRMAQLIVRPTVMDFLDFAMKSSELGLLMEEIIVSEEASFVGKTLLESGLRKKYDIIVVAIKRGSQPMIFNPKPDTKIMAGDILILLGDSSHIARLEKDL
ncbi:MAG: potassium channel protein [Desulfobulbus sp.]|nr:MAG: potassium channel protein [Desulfobulbus sp.]RUM41629.1 MAG: potassium channel protein [Desulfobulbus sp.]